MRRLLMIALLVAVGCGKSGDVAQVNPNTRQSGAPQEQPIPTVNRSPRPPLPTEKKFIDFPTRETRPVKIDKPNQNEVAGAVRDFMSTTFNNFNVTGASEPIEYPLVPETGYKGWVVAISYTGDNPVLKCHETGTNHLFLLSRKGENAPVRCYYHMQDEQVGKAKLGEPWYILNRPPAPETKTVP
jgi:hypothetical protein